MFNKKTLLSSLALYLSIQSINAQAIPESPFHYGAYASYSVTKVKDPDGKAGDSKEFSRGGLLFVYHPTRTSSIDTNIFYHSDSYFATTEEIGQKVNGYGLQALYYTQFSFDYKLRPFFGLGLSMNSLQYKERHTIDSAGFLAIQFPDREDSEFNAVFSAKMVTEFNNNIGILFRINYELPVDNGIEGIFLDLGILF